MRELDTQIIFTPKAHCKIADRGIEYVWGVAKMIFRKENATLDNDKRVNTLKVRVKKHDKYFIRNILEMLSIC